MWEEEGFVPYQVDQERVQNVPATFVKSTRWDTVDRDLGYFARSILLVEGEENPWVPVEFNSACFCWVEVRWETHRPGVGNWVAYRPARQELGLDIIEADFHAAADPREVSQIPDTMPSRPPSPTTHTTTPTSVFRILESPYTAPRAVTPAPIVTIAQLAAALNIQDNQMSTAITTEAITTQVGRIDPTMGHMFTTDDAARARATGPDRPNPPRHPFVGQSFSFRPAMGFPPPGHPASRMPGGGPPGGFPGRGGGGFPGGPGGPGGHQPPGQ